MKNILPLIAMLFIVCSCKRQEILVPQPAQKDGAAMMPVRQPEPSISARDLPAPYPPFIPQDLYVGRGYGTLAISSVSGTGYFFNPDQPPNIAMASTGGSIYSIIEAGNTYSQPSLYRLNPTSGAFTELSSVWANTDAMTAWGGFLYAIQGGTLWRVTASSGARAPFSAYPYGWEGTEAMAALDNFMYAIQGGTLWRVNLVNGSVSTYSAYPNGWGGTEAMAATNGGVFAVQGGTLWRVSTSNGSVAPFGAFPEGWGGTLAMTARSGFLYIVQGGVMWKVSTFNGSVAQLGTVSWNGTTAMTALNP